MSYPEFEKFNLEAGEILTREQLNALREAFDFTYIQGPLINDIKKLTAERDYYKELASVAGKIISPKDNEEAGKYISLIRRYRELKSKQL